MLYYALNAKIEGLALMNEEYKQYCLYKYVAELPKDKRDEFFKLFDKINGAAKLEVLKREARKVYLDLNK